MARKILIVDDQADILLILEREFRRLAGVSILTAKDSTSALAIIAERGVDLVISDVRMGTSSGFDLVREINQFYPGTGTILMTAYRSPSNRALAEELGVVLFLEKPFQIPRLIQEVEAYFQAKETPATAPEPGPSPTPVPPAVPAVDDSSALVVFKLQDLVQIFCLNGRNILITVGEGSGHSVGEIYIQKGNVIHASYNGKTGEDGFYTLMQLPSPVLKVKDWAEPVPVTITAGYMQLLIESAVHTDHEAERRASAG